MEYEASERHGNVPLVFLVLPFRGVVFRAGAMWLRLVILDRSGRVFGTRRYQLLAVYMLLTVAIPILGMIGELD